MDSDDLLKTTRRHFEAVMKKDLPRIVGAYARTEDVLVFVEGPRWATEGYDNVARGWRDFVGSAIEVQACRWLAPMRAKTVGALGFVAGIVELTVAVRGAAQTIRLRGTFVCEREADGGDWKIVHEHFSQPAADPYGIGDWLAPESD